MPSSAQGKDFMGPEKRSELKREEERRELRCWWVPEKGCRQHLQGEKKQRRIPQKSEPIAVRQWGGGVWAGLRRWGGPAGQTGSPIAPMRSEAAGGLDSSPHPALHMP